MLTKAQVIAEITRLVDSKINSLQERFDDLNSDLSDNHKSSAGDKHETGRAMTQLEQEKLSNQLNQLSIQKETISRLTLADSKRIQLGSIVKTSNAQFYISIGLGKVNVNGEAIFCISASSPIGQKILNLQAGDVYTFNGLKHKIISVS